MDEIYNGHFEVDDSTLVLHFKNSENMYDKSPFTIDGIVLDTRNYPLTFYTDITYVKCNTLLERLKRNREEFFKQLVEDEPDLENNPIYVKIKNDYDKRNLYVNDDMLVKIIDLVKIMFKDTKSPLKYITWLYNIDESVVFYQRDMRTLFIIDNDMITIWYYGYAKNKNRFEIYKFPENYDLIKKKCAFIQ